MNYDDLAYGKFYFDFKDEDEKITYLEIKKMLKASLSSFSNNASFMNLNPNDFEQESGEDDEKVQ